MSKTSKELVKRLLAVALTLVMVIGFMPVAAIPVYATEVGAEETTEPSAEPSQTPEPSTTPSEEPEITDVKVTAYVGEYDGEEHDAAEVVSAAGDVVKYKLDDGEETTDCPKIKDVKEYSLTVTVQREGYKDYTETVKPKISHKYNVTLNVAADTTYSGKDYDLLKSNPVIVTTAKDGKKVSSKDYNVSYEVNYTDNSGSGEPKTLDEPIGNAAGTYTITAKVNVVGYDLEIAVTGEVVIAKSDESINFIIKEGRKTIKPIIEDGKDVIKGEISKVNGTIKYDIKLDTNIPADLIKVTLAKDGEAAEEIALGAHDFSVGTYVLKAEIKDENKNNYENTSKEIIFAISYAESVKQIAIVADGTTDSYTLKDSTGIKVKYEYVNGGFGNTHVTKISAADGKVITDWFEITHDEKICTFTIELKDEYVDSIAEYIGSDIQVELTKDYAKSGPWYNTKTSKKSIAETKIGLKFADAGDIKFDIANLEIVGLQDDNNEWFRAKKEEDPTDAADTVVVKLKTGVDGYTISATAGGVYGESCNIEGSSKAIVVYVKDKNGKVAKVVTEWKVDREIPEVKINAEPITRKEITSGILKNITFGILGNEEKDYEVSFETTEKVSGVKSVYYTARYASLAEIENYYETLAVWNEWTEYEIEHGKWEAWTEYNKDPEKWQGDPPEKYTGEEPKTPDSSKPPVKPASPFNINNEKHEEISTADDNGTFTARIDTSAYYIIEYWVEDNAGNVSDHHFLGNYEVEYDEDGNYVASDPYNYLVIDKTAPKITITVSAVDEGTLIKNVNGVCYINSDNIDIHAEIDEENYALSEKGFSLFVNGLKLGNGEEFVDGGKNDSDNKKDTKIDYGFRVSTEHKYDGSYYLTATYEDPSGNEAEVAVKIGEVEGVNKFVIDTTAPEVNIIRDETVGKTYYPDPENTKNPEKINEKTAYYYNTDAKFKATVEDTNIGETTVYVLGNKLEKDNWDEGSKEEEVLFTIKGEKEKEIQLESADISAEHEDKAGNTTPVNFDGTVVIDMLNPVLNVTFNNAANTVGDTHYYNSDINATFTVTEKYFANDLMKLDVGDGSGEEKMGFSDDNNPHTYTKGLTKEGKYQLVVTGTDKAGNVLVGGNVEVNEEGKYTSDALVIDKTITAPTIGGVEPGHAYKDKDISVSVKGDDTNFDQMTVVITKTYMANENGKTVQRTAEVYNETFYTGNTYSYRVPDGRDADGIYVVTATIRDKATNTATSTPVTFTVNRYGSVYEYVSGITEVNGKYVQKVGEELVIWEYSATELEGNNESLMKNVGIYADGSKIDASDIKVELEHQNGGWYKYIYTIPTVNFDTDAHYKVEISSESVNGVRSSNTKIQNLVAIDFFKDGTAPVLENVTGMEKSIYNEAEHEIKFNIYDSIGLASVKVLVNNEEVFSKEDFEDAMNYEGSVTLDESDSKQHVRFIITDLAGNVTDTDADGFDPDYTFERDLTVSTNFFVRLRANTPLLIGCIAGVVVILALGVILIIRKKDKKEEEKTAAAK